MSERLIERLKDYKAHVARIQVLSSYSIGSGMTVSRLNQDDQLQELHRKLRMLPTYMYLNKKEQALETVAHAYLTKYPPGTRSQLRAIPKSGADVEDEKLLRELRQKIKKVIEARAGNIDDCDAVLDRLSELQDLQQEVRELEATLVALESYKPEYAKLLRLHYVEGKTAEDVAEEMNIARVTFFRWRPKAAEEFSKLSAV